MMWGVCVGVWGRGTSIYRGVQGHVLLRKMNIDRQTGAYSAVLPVGFPSLCPA